MDVPQTIRDAMLLCELLSIQYLWVDAVCLEQSVRDHVAACDSQSYSKMRNIYGAAYITIVLPLVRILGPAFRGSEKASELPLSTPRL
jgi:Heterokaryon incompatibility protein (HET)